MEEQMTDNTDGWHKQPHYTQHELDVMMRMIGSQLVSVTNPILKKPLESCSIGLDRKELHDRLLSAMEHYQGIGLSQIILIGIIAVPLVLGILYFTKSPTRKGNIKHLTTIETPQEIKKSNFCTNCGISINEKTAFCTNCGTKIT